jgi:hypothetical protein
VPETRAAQERSFAAENLDVEIVALEALATHDLRIAWRRLHRSEPPTRLSRDLMVRAIAYRMQERAQGGLNPATRRRLRALAETVELIGKRAFDPGISLKPGVRLVREWGGLIHTVTVLENGFDYAGQRHRSLTRIASLITGAHWSGPRFFGIRKARPKPTAAIEAGNA